MAEPTHWPDDLLAAWMRGYLQFRAGELEAPPNIPAGSFLCGELPLGTVVGDRDAVTCPGCRQALAQHPPAE